jgi:site-specific recombinase XerC
VDTLPISQTQTLLTEYEAFLIGKTPSTVDAYLRVLRQLVQWVAQRPGSGGEFHPQLLTKTAMETYIAYLEANGYSIAHRARVKSAVSGFARWLIEEKGILQRNPTRGLNIPPQPLYAPRVLSADQRYILRHLIERDDSKRSEALFALGYWAGCRVSDVSWLLMEHTHVGAKVGWLHVGYKGSKARDIDLINAARRPLYEYIYHGGRDPESSYTFTSQRSERLTEAGIHRWWKKIKAQAKIDEWELIHDVTFHDLRHDFAHRAREAGWTLEEVAYYLGHITKKGTPAIQTTVRYTQGSRQQVKAKLGLLKG